jgi:hypothetical protein
VVQKNGNFLNKSPKSKGGCNMKNNHVWLDGIIAAIIVMAVVGWMLLRKFGVFILLLIICILLLTRCGSIPVLKNIKYATPRQSITSYPVVFTANISLGDGKYYQGEAVAYNDPNQEGPVDYVIFWWEYPRELHSIFYKKGEQWYWKIQDNEPKTVNHLEVGGVEIF